MTDNTTTIATAATTKQPTAREIVSRRRLQPWANLVRGGMPPFVVIRRPLTFGDHTYPVGAIFPPSTNRGRMRQLYEQRRIGVAVASPSIVTPPIINTNVNVDDDIDLASDALPPTLDDGVTDANTPDDSGDDLLPPAPVLPTPPAQPVQVSRKTTAKEKTK